MQYDNLNKLAKSLQLTLGLCREIMYSLIIVIIKIKVLFVWWNASPTFVFTEHLQIAILKKNFRRKTNNYLSTRRNAKVDLLKKKVEI